MPAKKLEVSTSLIHSHKVPEGVAVAWGLVVEDDMTIGPGRGVCSSALGPFHSKSIWYGAHLCGT